MHCWSNLALPALLMAGLLPAQDAPPSFEFAETLSATGYYESTADKRIGDGFVPYLLNSPLWSDGANKDRFVRVPEGEKIRFHADAEWEIPAGTVFLQTLYFEDDGARVYTETRVIVHDADELRFASYAWDDDAQDAELAPELGDELYANHGDVSQVWSIAARSDCAECHNESIGVRTLGLATAQLNRAGVDGVNQLERFAQLGLVEGVPADRDSLPALVDPRDPHAELDARVRSYLQTNCSTCHRPGGEGSGTLDLRLETPLAETGLLRGRIIRPGKPERSGVLGRMYSVDWDRMPNLLTTVPDDFGIAMIGEWIRNLPKPAATSRQD